MAIVHAQSRRAHVTDPQVEWLVRGAVAWAVLAVLAVAVMSLLSRDGSGRSAGVDGLPLTAAGWLMLVVPVVMTLVAWRWGQDSRTALVVPALVHDLGIVALGDPPALLFTPAALAVTVAALARRD